MGGEDDDGGEEDDDGRRKQLLLTAAASTSFTAALFFSRQQCLLQIGADFLGGTTIGLPPLILVIVGLLVYVVVVWENVVCRRPFSSPSGLGMTA